MNYPENYLHFKFSTAWVQHLKFKVTRKKSLDMYLMKLIENQKVCLPSQKIIIEKSYPKKISVSITMQ